jgi:hypothetical protein
MAFIIVKKTLRKMFSACSYNKMFSACSYNKTRIKLFRKIRKYEETDSAIQCNMSTKY